jgi:3-mercaptopyruvate sulfurtransferase SseA
MRTLELSCLFISILVFFQSGSALVRKMSSVAIATYEEVKELPKHPEKLLIDVREPAEIAETGKIPTSINIPCKF